MENINETLLVSIDLSSTEESKIEIVTYMGQHRTIINTFKGKDAELFYKTIFSKNLNPDSLKKLSMVSLAEPVLDDLEIELDKKDILSPIANIRLFFTDLERAKKVLTNIEHVVNTDGYIGFGDVRDILGLDARYADNNKRFYSVDLSSIIDAPGSDEYVLTLRVNKEAETSVDPSWEYHSKDIIGKVASVTDSDDGITFDVIQEKVEEFVDD